MSWTVWSKAVVSLPESVRKSVKAGMYSSHKSCQVWFALSISWHGITLAVEDADARHAEEQPCASTLYHGDECGSEHPHVTPQAILSSRAEGSWHFWAKSWQLAVVSLCFRARAAAFLASWELDVSVCSSQQSARAASSFMPRWGLGLKAFLRTQDHPGWGRRGVSVQLHCLDCSSLGCPGLQGIGQLGWRVVGDHEGLLPTTELHFDVQDPFFKNSHHFGVRHQEHSKHQEDSHKGLDLAMQTTVVDAKWLETLGCLS